MIQVNTTWSQGVIYEETVIVNLYLSVKGGKYLLKSRSYLIVGRKQRTRLGNWWMHIICCMNKKMLEGSTNLDAFTDIDMLKVFVVCFKSLLFHYCDYINLPSQTC